MPRRMLDHVLANTRRGLPAPNLGAEKNRKRLLRGVVSTGGRNTLIFLERWSVYDEVSYASETPFIVAAFRLLILTGCRLGEIQTLNWDYITLRHMERPDTKTGARRIPLPQAARDILDALPRYADNPYVIAGKLEGRFATDFKHPWRRIRARAGLPEVRIHDLRHTYASMVVSGGMPIQMVRRLLGHSQLQTTMRYAHLADDPVLEAAQQNVQQLSALISAQGRGKRICVWCGRPRWACLLTLR